MALDPVVLYVGSRQQANIWHEDKLVKLLLIQVTQFHHIVFLVQLFDIYRLVEGEFDPSTVVTGLVQGMEISQSYALFSWFWGTITFGCGRKWISI